MFFGRSARSLEGVLRQHPEWREPIRRVVDVLAQVPRGGLIDPALVARLARLERMQALGYLNVLRRAGLGDIVVRVVDNSGVEVRRYPSVRHVPARVEDDFGEEVVVMPENIDIAFEPRSTPEAAAEMKRVLAGAGA
jgi:hypothetical protein